MKKQWRRILALCLAVLSFTANVYAAPEMLVPVGRAVGIHLCGDLVVVGFDEEYGSQAKAAGVEVGDRIVAVNGIPASSPDSLRTAADAHGGVRLTVERKGKQVEFDLCAAQTAQGRRIGLKIRDGITGIGTVTFYDPETGSFGALGHSVNDPETGECIPISGGSIMEASVADVVKGVPGKPGELKGDFGPGSSIGEIAENVEAGVFGSFTAPPACGELLPVADASQVQKAGAEILSNVAGTDVRPYSVEITKIDALSREGRNFLFEVRDENLLAQTGGIVQGMSGSPVIQNGRLIGAVTHVLVDDPTRGYGIFIENMLDAQNAA